ncbi:hypothetical protein GQ53DRAFT_683880 [Thozetella sp. PMI_491]|nr:hypothetical protein GQ53DRAFT_683880 [Thozetella sp. PMI_491]
MADPSFATTLAGEDASTLRLGHVSLTLGADALSILDTKANKPSRTCGFAAGSSSPSQTRSIPYRNILWAELSEDGTKVTINYAKATSKTRLEAQSLSWNVDTPDPKIQSFVARLLDNAYPSKVARQKRAWVVVNPKAGPGQADVIWEQQVKPIFEGAKMAMTVVRTKAPKETITLAENLDVDAYDIAVSCSGDGGPYEIFNGFGRRPDARRVLGKIAVCLVPGGSGNGFTCNLYGTLQPSQVALSIVKGLPTPMDLVSVTQGSTRVLSFLSQAYGIMADIDIKTEHLRWMGDTRFVVGFLQLVFKKKTYPCDIAYKVEIDGKDAIRAHYRGHLEGKNPSVTTDGQSDATSSVADLEQGLPPLRYGTSEDKLPEGWEVIPHEKLGFFFCGNMGYMADKLNFFPAALHNDGLMDLVTIDGDHNPFKMIDLQNKVPANHFYDHEIVSYRKVSAFRLTPRTTDDNGVVSIDGEAFPYKTFQAEVHPSLGLTLTRTGKYEAPGPRGWEKA